MAILDFTSSISLQKYLKPGCYMNIVPRVLKESMLAQVNKITLLQTPSGSNQLDAKF